MMEHVICVVPVMPLRAGPAHQSEMVSQLIFGECAIILENFVAGEWVKIRNQYDRYEGWATKNQLVSIEEELYQEPTEEYTSELLTQVSVSGHPMYVPLGSFLKGIRHGEMQWSKVNVLFKGEPLKPDHTKITDKQIRHLAYQYLNVPYLWGGRSVFGVDCSGFTQSVYRLAGKVLPRDASQQVKCGKEIGEETAPKCGDMAFFKDKEGKIVHVGLMLNDFEIIHAAGKVRVDRLDKKGILKSDTNEYTHELAMIRRLS